MVEGNALDKKMNFRMQKIGFANYAGISWKLLFQAE